MSDPAGDLYKTKVALAQIVQESIDLYRLACAASGFDRDEYGNKVSSRVADSLFSLRDCLMSTGRTLRSHIRLPQGDPVVPPQSTSVTREAPEQSTTVPPRHTSITQSVAAGNTVARDGITVADAVVTLQRHCRRYVDDPHRGGTSARQRDLAARLLDALSGAALLRE